MTGIDEYKRKRDFGKTPEPEPGSGRDRGDRLVFVVHRHDASRLHYDLRLEMEGVLRSWAVPKGFSYDPDDKHLAVRTEDHPIEYEHFSGVIPKGQYGAGTMTIWDRGTYEVVKADSGPEAVEAGELKVLLYGKKLRGEWHLVRTKQADNSWLLFKSRDRYAGKARATAIGDLDAAVEADPLGRVEPMLVGGTSPPFSNPDWVFEMGFAGRRVLAEKNGDFTRVGDFEGLDRIRGDLSEVGAERALLDGVLVAPGDDGRPSKELLETRLLADEPGQIQLYVFDLLYFDDFDLRPMSLVERKAGLRRILPATASVLYVDHVPGNGEELVDAVRAAGLSTVIAKRGESTYASGPSDDWLEIPVETDHDATQVSVGEAIQKSRGRSAPSRVKFTNLDKVFWPAEGYTKGNLIRYYDEVADVLLPYLRDRPLHMNRYPDGIDGKSFYQKNVRDLVPDWVQTVPVASSRKEEGGEYIVANDRDTLLLLANLASIDIHPWMSRVNTPDSPDYAVIDLDPKEAPFAHVIEIAGRTGELLFEIGLRPLLKTSGKTGLHIHIPLAPGYSYDQSRTFCEGVARVVANDLPEIATVERAVGNREGKVYVDFGQNRRQQTIVPPYSVRPVRGATVSAPLAWDELTDDLSPAQFTIQTLPPRLEARGDLFHALLSDPQELLPAIEALQSRLTR